MFDNPLATWSSLPEIPPHDWIKEVAARCTSPADSNMVRFWIRIYATRHEIFHCRVHEALEKNDRTALRSCILMH
jgi:hypothetical protein